MPTCIVHFCLPFGPLTSNSLSFTTAGYNTLPNLKSLSCFNSLPKQSKVLKILTKLALENTEGKRENANNKHFLLFPLSFLPNQNQILSSEPHLDHHLQN